MGRQAIAERWSIDPETGCWIWSLKIGTSGYGDSWCPRTQSVRKAHRVVYEQLIGSIPSGLELDHLCRNRACVNPEHLEPVTREENIRRSPIAKLDVERVTALRAEYAAGTPPRELARKYGISRNSIGNIVRRETWCADLERTAS